MNEVITATWRQQLSLSHFPIISCHPSLSNPGLMRRLVYCNRLSKGIFSSRWWKMAGRHVNDEKVGSCGCRWLRARQWEGWPQVGPLIPKYFINSGKLSTSYHQTSSDRLVQSKKVLPKMSLKPSAKPLAQSSSGSSRGESHSGRGTDLVLEECSDTSSQAGRVVAKGKIRGKKRQVVVEPPHPDTVVREEVFNHLAYCGFLDQTLEHLYRWAVLVIWDMQVYKAQ